MRREGFHESLYGDMSFLQVNGVRLCVCVCWGVWGEGGSGMKNALIPSTSAVGPDRFSLLTVAHRRAVKQSQFRLSDSLLQKVTDRACLPLKHCRTVQ